MIDFLSLPQEFIYMNERKSSYEQFMADDPTGINRVLDKMYGIAFNSSQIELFFSEPSIYFDCAYELAIRIRLQKYPHRYLKMLSVYMCADKMLRIASSEKLAKRKEACQARLVENDNSVFRTVNGAVPFDDEDIQLVLWMVYALLAFRDDNDELMQEFLGVYLDYISNDDAQQNSYVCMLLTAWRKKEGEKVCNCHLTPRPASPAKLAGVDLNVFDHLLDEADVASLLGIFRDKPRQEAVCHVVLSQQLTISSLHNLASRVEKGEFLPSAACLPQLPEAASDDDKSFWEQCKREMETMKRQVDFYKSQCECYGQKVKLDSSIDRAVELGKAANEQLQQDYDQLKQETEQKIKRLLEDLRRTQTRADEAIRKYSLLASTKRKVAAEPKPSIDMKEILLQLTDHVEDPEFITDSQLPGAERMLGLLMDLQQVEDAIDLKARDKLAKRLRHIQDERRKKEKARRQADSRGVINNTTHVYGDQVGHKDISIDRNYGPNIALQATEKEKPAALDKQKALLEDAKPGEPLRMNRINTRRINEQWKHLL